MNSHWSCVVIFIKQKEEVVVKTDLEFVYFLVVYSVLPDLRIDVSIPEDQKCQPSTVITLEFIGIFLCHKNLSSAADSVERESGIAATQTKAPPTAEMKLQGS